jgi:Zn-dependent protease with chaperone function
LAHESIHILRNHIVSIRLWAALEQAAKGPKQENKTIVELIKTGLALVSPYHLPPNARALRDNEYEADKIAVKMTGCSIGYFLLKVVWGKSE